MQFMAVGWSCNPLPRWKLKSLTKYNIYLTHINYMTIVSENHMVVPVYGVFDILSVCYSIKKFQYKYIYILYIYISIRPFAEADFAFSCVCAGEAKAAGENLHDRINVICSQLMWRAQIFWLNLSEIVPPWKRNTKSIVSSLQKQIFLPCKRNQEPKHSVSSLLPDQVHHDNQDEEEKDECDQDDGDGEELGEILRSKSTENMLRRISVNESVGKNEMLSNKIYRSLEW